MMVSVSRNGRTRKAKEVYTPSKHQAEIGKKRAAKFSLNKGKAIKKKIGSTYKEDINAEYKRGTLVITLPTAEFEAFRICVKSLPKSNPGLGITIQIDTTTDKNDLVVGESISVKQAATDKQLYRINLHLTTSVVSVNGTKLSEFTECHVDLIVNKMEYMGNFKEINKTIRDKLKMAEKNLGLKQLNSEQGKQENEENGNNDEYRQKSTTQELAAIDNKVSRQDAGGHQDEQWQGTGKQLDLNGISKGPDENKGKNSGITTTEHHMKKIQTPYVPALTFSTNRSSSQSETNTPNKQTTEDKVQETLCSVCDQSCVEDRIYCDMCAHWSHFKCENLSNIEINETKNGEHLGYTCRGCWSIEAMIRSDVGMDADNKDAGEVNNMAKKVQMSDKNIETSPIVKCDIGTNTTTQHQDDIVAIQREHAKVVKRMEGELKKKEENIADLAKQLATARAYIINLEQKINNLEKSKNLQTVTTEDERQLANNSHTQIQDSQLQDKSLTNQRLALLEQRMNAMEITALKDRMAALECKMGNGRNENSTARYTESEHESQTTQVKSTHHNCATQCVENKSGTLETAKPDLNADSSGGSELHADTDDAMKNHHFLGKRRHVKEPPWGLQADHSQKKKKKKQKKKSVKEQVQLKAGGDQLNRTQLETVTQSRSHQPILSNTQPTQIEPIVQDQIHQLAQQNYPAVWNRPQTLQHRQTVTQAPQTLMANSLAPMQYPTIPWVLINPNQQQNLQSVMIRNQVTQKSYMNYQ